MSPDSSITPNRWLRLARWGILAYAFFVLILFLAGLLLFPAYAEEHYLAFTPNDFWTPEQTQAALAEVGLPSTYVAWRLLITETLILGMMGILGLFLLWRKSNDWFILFVGFSFLLFAPGNTVVRPVIEAIPHLEAWVTFVGGIGWQLFFILFYLFPDGHFVPRWTRWMPVLWLGVNLVPRLFGVHLFQSTAGQWVGIGLVVTAVGSQIYRYGWRATLVQRQQTKWIVAVLIVVILFVALIAPGIFQAPHPSALGPTLIRALVGNVLFQLLFLAIPVAIVIAILRYRLWDIDLIIRKTLLYSVLTALLALVYFGTVILLQRLLGNVLSESSTPATVLSTLLIAALFVPLRRRIQNFLDRRFFRRKYDADKILANFANYARQETDPDRLTAELTHIVQDIMQPQVISLWLKPTNQNKKRPNELTF